MLLGKRPRPAMKRTTSMNEFAHDLSNVEAQQPLDPNNPFSDRQKQAVYDGLDQRFHSTVSPRSHRRNSADFLETALFLRSCFLCKRRLVPGRDIYMYRGDSAFCSLECRQQQMNQDERKEKCSMASKKEATSASAAAAAGSKTETVAAV